MSYQVPVLQRHVDAATQTDAGTSLMHAIIDPVTGVPGAVLAQQSLGATQVNIDGVIYDEDIYTLGVQTIERSLGIKPISGYVAVLTYATGPL